MKERDFIENKKQTMSKLKNAKNESKVDVDIIPIIDLINSFDEYYTSSSCYGRIALLELPEVGDKQNAKFLGKWHRKIEKNEFLESIKKSSKGQIWFLAQSPIIHVFSKDLDSGDKLVKKAISCGFKNSGFRSVKKNIVVEIASTERIDLPVGIDGHLYLTDEHIDFLIEISNNIIERFSEKLDRLKEELINY